MIKFYDIMSDSELREEAWRRPSATLPPVPRLDFKPLSFQERQEVIRWLKDNDAWNDAFDSFMKRTNKDNF